MKVRIGQPVQSVAGVTKKRYTPTHGKDGFFVPGVTLSVNPRPFLSQVADAPTTGIPLNSSFLGTSANRSAAGVPSGLVDLASHSDPAAVFFLTRNLALGGRCAGRSCGPAIATRPGRFFSFCRFVKEHIVTLTEHIKRIEELSSQSLDFLQDEKYFKLISNLESLRSHANSAITIYHESMYRKENRQDFRDLIWP